MMRLCIVRRQPGLTPLRQSFDRGVGRLAVQRRLLVSKTGAQKAEISTSKAIVFAERPSFARRLWDAYTRSLAERPLLTKATFAAVVFFCSDTATQYLVRPDDDSEDGFEWDAARALSGAGFGIVATGWLHHWWGFLEAAVGKRLPLATHKLANTATKVLLDQAIGAPLYIYSYYVLTNFLTSQFRRPASSVSSSRSKPAWDSWLETNAKAAEMLFPTMLQHWRVWVPVHSVNFYLIPLHHRVMVQNTVLVFWSGYLSHLNHSRIIMSPDEEIKVTIVRRETERKLTQEQLAAATTSKKPALSSTTTTKH